MRMQKRVDSIRKLRTALEAPSPTGDAPTTGPSKQQERSTKNDDALGKFQFSCASGMLLGAKNMSLDITGRLRQSDDGSDTAELAREASSAPQTP